MAGFEYRFRTSGGQPTILNIVQKDSETLSKGDILNLESGQLDLGATADTNLVGVCLETKTGTGGTTKFEVVTDEDAVYGITDANARLIGDTLDLSGTTGAQGVTTSSNKEFVVHSTCSASQETLVRINVGKHYRNKAQ